MAPRDRTAEFHAALSSIRARTAVPAKGKPARLPDREGAATPLLGQQAPVASSSKSEFGRLAGNIAKDINGTTVKLQKLAQCEYPERGGGIMGSGMAHGWLGDVCSGCCRRVATGTRL